MAKLAGVSVEGGGEAEGGADEDDSAFRGRAQQRHSWHGSRRGSLIPLKDMGRGLSRTDPDIPAESAAEEDMTWDGLRQHPC